MFYKGTADGSQSWAPLDSMKQGILLWKDRSQISVHVDSLNFCQKGAVIIAKIL